LEGVVPHRGQRPQGCGIGMPDPAEVVVPCHIFLPVVSAARVIGKNGVSIRTIREQSGANVQILQKELPQEMQRREDRIIVITGTVNEVEQGVHGVLERVFDRSGLPQASDRGNKNGRPHIVEVLVPEKSGSHLIGSRGERIKAMIEETQCDVHVVKEPMVGLADQKRVRVTGNSADEAINAVLRLQEVLGELAAGGVLRPEHFELREAYSPGPSMRSTRNEKEVPIRLLVSSEDAAWIVGRRGNKITRLRDLAKVQMNDADSPPFDESERVVEIAAAALESRIRVVQLILEDVALRQEASKGQDLRILVPTEQFGSVMGHRGETIRRIMSSTGAKLKQHKAEKLEDGADYRLRLIEIKGDDRQQVQVVHQVHTALEMRGRDIPAQPTGMASNLSFNIGAQAVPHSSMPAMQPSAKAVMTSNNAQLSVGAVDFVPSHALESPLEPTNQVPMSLQLAMPSEEVARQLAGDTSGIAWKAGVRLAAGRGAGGAPILQVTGTAVGNAVACYLIQDRLFLMH